MCRLRFHTDHRMDGRERLEELTLSIEANPTLHVVVKSEAELTEGSTKQLRADTAQFRARSSGGRRAPVRIRATFELPHHMARQVEPKRLAAAGIGHLVFNLVGPNRIAANRARQAAALSAPY